MLFFSFKGRLFMKSRKRVVLRIFFCGILDWILSGLESLLLIYIFFVEVIFDLFEGVVV